MQKGQISTHEMRMRRKLDINNNMNIDENIHAENFDVSFPSMTKSKLDNNLKNEK